MSSPGMRGLWAAVGGRATIPRVTKFRGTERMFAQDSCANKHRSHTQRIPNLDYIFITGSEDLLISYNSRRSNRYKVLARDTVVGKQK